jgi:hypothetical protein
LGVSVQHFTQQGGLADFACPFIWSRVPDLIRIRNESNKGTASVHQMLCNEAAFLSRDRTIFPMEKSKLTKTEKDETGEEQSQEHAHHFP